MGIALSSSPTMEGRATDVTRESETMSDASAPRDNGESETSEEFHDTIDEDDASARIKAKEEEMEVFKKQLNIKREQRREILNRHRSEKEELEKSLDHERKARLETCETNRRLRELLVNNNIEIPDDLQSSKETSEITETIIQMREEFEKLKSNNNKLRWDLTESNSALQGAYSDIADLNEQNRESIKQINALKEVITVSKTMINLREQQLNELKNKLNEIERSLADREANMLSADLRKEYERQLQNIRTLRGLYEERARLAEVTRQGLVRELEEQKRLKTAEINKCKELTTKLEELETKVDELHERIENKNNQITSCQDETRGLKAEMSVINKLFSQVLLGYKTKQDLDKLVHRLEENHGLLTHMAEKENGSEASTALPKLLLELVSQIEEEEENKETKEIKVNEIDSPEEDKSTGEPVADIQSSNNASAEEIVENLPKVWRVLMELLSHQSVPEESSSEKVTTCYKSVETKSGPVLVPSVSQTYIRLKDLIVEKLALIKEVHRMKQLNTHLETRLEEQERRLCLVTTELSKTWHVVGRLRRHHHQLHTHEKILKYELQQKRKLLNELKEELEYCREKWEQAREKNSQSERDLKKLRAEFSSRKTKAVSAAFNNSAESGYSDERPSDDSSESNDESEYLTEPLKRSKKKLKKSFETILDSSTDFNLAAEREDPASDMLDVADLPLDTQDGDENHESCVSDSCNSESFLKSEKVCEETEDEVGEIANDSCVEEIFTLEQCEKSRDHSSISVVSGKEEVEDKPNDKKDPSHDDQKPSSTSSSGVSQITLDDVPKIDPAAILESIRQQNERLAKKDKKLERLEKNGAALLKQTQNTVEISKQIDSTLDHLINRPTTSRQNTESNLPSSFNNSNEDKISKKCQEPDMNSEDILETANDKDVGIEEISKRSEESNIDCHKNKFAKIKADETNENNFDQNEAQPSAKPENDREPTAEPTCSTDFTAILDSIKQQNERLAKKDERLKKLESDCCEVVENITSTLSTGEELIEKLNILHDEQAGNSDETQSADKADDTSSRDGSEPSTSSDIDARFAARDLRLKRLEEQTKSLVNKVNNTTTKGVKIHYKLEELHKVYGSENSRAGTPSEDNDDPQNNEDDSLD